MQTLRAVLALLSVSVFASLVVRTVVAPAASQQMAAKQQILAEFRQDMEQCYALEGADAKICEQRAHAWVDRATIVLDSERNRAQPRWLSMEALDAQAKARCNALSGPIRAWCQGGGSRESSQAVSASPVLEKS